MRLLFVSPYNPEAYGVRSLASHISNLGHVVHILLVKHPYMKWVENVPENAPHLFYSQFKFAINDIRQNAFTDIEQGLYADFLAQWHPDIIGFSVFGLHKNIFPSLAHIASQECPGALRLAGGVGPTLEPEFFLRNGAQAVLRGEGEIALPSFMDAFENGGEVYKQPNLVWLDNDILRQNPVLPPLRDFSIFPEPLHDKSFFSCIENNVLCPGTGGANKGICITSRGCLGSCSYCGAESLRKVYSDQYPGTPRLRIRNIDNVFKELRILKNNGLGHIKFFDDFFVRPSEEMRHFFMRYKEEINIPFLANFHPQQLVDHPDLIALAMSAGCGQFTFGIQSGSQKFCKDVYNRRFPTQEYKQLFSMITKLGGDITLQFIGGNPLEDEEQFVETLNFCKLLPYDFSLRTETLITVFNLLLTPGLELIRKFPNINKLPRATKDFCYKALLLDIRRVANDSEFEQIKENSDYRNDPKKLHAYMGWLIQKKIGEYLMEQAKRLKGKKVHFWGAGNVYRLNRHIFGECDVQNIIIDEGFDFTGAIKSAKGCLIDGIPAIRPGELVHDTQKLPVIIFARQSRAIHKRMKEQFPMFKDVILCSDVVEYAVPR